jgi:hypothetical protein
MPTIGLDCQVILDGQGYWLMNDSYACHRPRVHRGDYNRNPASGTAGVGLKYVDMGPGKRLWVMDVICWQAIRDYAGNPVTTTGQAYRDALHTSYQKRKTQLVFVDPTGVSWNVYFVDLVERIDDIRDQTDGEVQYFCGVTLLEA